MGTIYDYEFSPEQTNNIYSVEDKTNITTNSADDGYVELDQSLADSYSEQPNKLKTYTQNKKHLSEEEMSWWPKYQDQTDNIGRPRGIDDSTYARFNESTKHGVFQGSLVNKVHIMRVGQIPSLDDKLATKLSRNAVTFSDLCKKYNGIIQYDPDDFLYCKNLGLPVNRLITLRRFPYAVTDNIYDKYNQSHPDIARMVTFFTDETNKLEEILSFTFGLRWKELTAEMEQQSMLGDQSGLSGFMGRIMKYIDPVLAKNKLQGENALNFNPTFDQNKVYGPVDSINSTHIRDVGFEFGKEFTISFDYELRSYNGRTPEYAMRDIIANALAVTYNNGKFWGGARYWVGERPTQYLSTFQGILNPSSVNEFVEKARTGMKSIIAQASGGNTTSKIQALKNAMNNVLKNAMAVGIGKILDSVGRASIITTNSLLSGEPIGNWHMTVGNPDNPILCIGNLMCTGIELKFPTDELSYGEFPTKVSFEVRLKPAMAKDRAGMETMFNMGRQRIYHNPQKIKISRKNAEQLEPSKRTQRVYSDEDVDSEKILQTFNETFDFTPLKTTKGQDGKEKVVGKNVEIVIDGKEYSSEVDYDSKLASSLPDTFSSDAQYLNDFETKMNQQQPRMNQQQQTKMNTLTKNTPMNITGQGAYPTDYTPLPVNKVDGPIGFNNPGNVRDINKGGKFASYQTLQDGYNAQVNQLNRYKTGKTTTGINGNYSLEGMLNVYAPSSDNNDPNQYAKVVGKILGISTATPIKDINSYDLAVAMSKMEGNKWAKGYNYIIQDGPNKGKKITV